MVHRPDAPWLGLKKRVADEIAKVEHVEAALKLAQKMEGVGQPTGGLARDVKNLLTASRESLPSGLAPKRGKINGAERYIKTIQAIAERAAALTHRLLAFSRRQTLEPKVIDVCDLVKDFEDMLRRALGPSMILHIARVTKKTIVDLSQLDNSTLNLALNARDAMPVGGAIRATVYNRLMNDTEGAGEYISGRIHDTSTAMSPELAERVFEPFVTMKCPQAEVIIRSRSINTEPPGSSPQRQPDLKARARSPQSAAVLSERPRLVSEG